MNIYVLEQTENTGYDTYDACVVCAENENEAKSMHPAGYALVDGKFPGDEFEEWASRPENVKCTLIGVAGNSVAKGILLASFNHS